jgi:hypothetical protein
MLKPIKHDTAAKHKKSKSVKSNIAVHPFVLAALMAAITIVVMGIIFLWLSVA